jgi:hypothetical protein
VTDNVLGVHVLNAKQGKRAGKAEKVAGAVRRAIRNLEKVLQTADISAFSTAALAREKYHLRTLPSRVVRASTAAPCKKFATPVRLC